MKDLSLYIHIPFCKSKCSYCDFLSFADKDEKIEDYINALLTELKLYKDKLSNYQIKTIFIGGGTPTNIDAVYIEKILNYINKNYNVENLEEVSIESNPGTLNEEKIKTYIRAGINRVSLGVQSLNDDILSSIGRIHTSKDFYDSFKLLRQMGIKNINVDLMFGLPSQSMEDVVYSLDKMIDLGVEHISYYGLILEEGTKLYDLYEKDKIFLPSEEKEREMYHSIVSILKNNGYDHYEISNFSLPGYECKHNLVYWDINPYIGIGLNSHSNMGGKRFSNTIDMDRYIDLLDQEKLPVIDQESIDKDTEIEEFCIMGLRKIAGIDKIQFFKRFDLNIEDIYNDEIQKHVKGGLINNNKYNISLTSKGLDLSNLVEIDFLK